MNKFFKKNLPAAIIATILLAVVILSGALIKENFNQINSPSACCGVIH